MRKLISRVQQHLPKKKKRNKFQRLHEEGRNREPKKERGEQKEAPNTAHFTSSHDMYCKVEVRFGKRKTYEYHALDPE